MAPLMKILNRFGWILFIFLAIGVGAYPLMYYVTDVIADNGLLSQKGELKGYWLWATLFHTHIIMGGLSLLVGWPQFLKAFRNRNLSLHRSLGKVYLLAVLFSGLAGLYLAIYAEGGFIGQSGFTGLAMAWLLTSTMAYITIRKGKVNAHRQWMIRSYALAFAAVTLRVWLPTLQYALGFSFITAYMIVAWLCWVPNLIWAEWKVRFGLS